MSEEKLIAEGEFVFPNGDEYRGSFISTENGIQMHGAGVLTSKQEGATSLSFFEKYTKNVIFITNREFYPG